MEFRDFHPMAELAFPGVARELLDADAPANQVEAFLLGARAWRESISAWLGSEGRRDYLSERLSRTLRFALGSEASPDESAEPYRLGTFPGLPTSGAVGADGVGQRLALAILLWRSRVVDYLADAWDVIGEAAPDPRECANAERLFSPVGEGERCANCLQSVSTDDAAEHRLSCVILRLRTQQDQVAGHPSAKSPWDEPLEPLEPPKRRG